MRMRSSFAPIRRSSKFWSQQWEKQLPETTDVVVVGAGPAGLAVGASLRKAGLSFIILEKEHQVASSWRRHYERLHLHTVKQFSSLPYLPFPKSYPRYVPRDLVIEYLDGYAAHFGLQPRFGDAARSIRRNGNDWVVEATSSSLRAPYVVIASGYNAEPVMPSVPGIEKFNGKVIHSADYVNAKPFAGQSILVVGMGNTGAEIALDLVEAGARPTISLRDGVHIVPRDLFGVPVQMVAMLAAAVLPAGASDAIFPLILDAVFGKLSQYGIRRPKMGILEQVASAGRIPVLDVGTVRKICEGKIKIAAGTAAIAADGVAFEGGNKGAFDAIIFATGYRVNYRSLLAPDDVPPVNAAATAEDRNSRIYFVGFRNAATGLLREIAKEAVQVAADIARRRNASMPRPS